MAAAAGVHSEETFTGFKWIGNIVLERPDLRFVFGYEQALGYLVTHRPLDKDGIRAAVMMAEIAALAAADGVTLQDRLDAIAARFGRYVIAELSVRLDPALGADWVRSIEATRPPRSAAGWSTSCDVSGGGTGAPGGRRRPAPADPPERHRTEGQALRRGRRRRPRPSLAALAALLT